MTHRPRLATDNLALSIALVVVALAQTVTAVAAERGHGTHVHGVGTLNVAVDGPSVEIEFRSPGANIVGFEHIAKTKEDRQAIDAATASMKSANELFLLPEAAACRLIDVKAEAPATEEHVEQGHGKHSKVNETHSDFHAHYRYRCERPNSLTHIDVQLFRQFPDTRRLTVQTISPRGQHAQTLTPDTPRLKF